MANYPTTVPQHITSTHETFDDLTIERAIDGSAHARVLFAEPKHRFTVKHVMTFSEFADLKTFYNNNKTTPFSFDWEGEGDTQQYSNCCLFEAMPKSTELGNGRLAVEVKIVTI